LKIEPAYSTGYLPAFRWLAPDRCYENLRYISTLCSILLGFLNIQSTLRA
jgi:hypothetical protein